MMIRWNQNQAVDSPGRIDPEEALALLKVADLPELMGMANRLRRQRHGPKAYFVHSLNLNPTNVCVSRCNLCAFWREPGAPGSYVLGLEQARETLDRAAAWDLTDLHIVGGLDPRLDLQYYESLIGLARRALPSVLIQGLTAVEVHYLAGLEKTSVGQVLARLKEAGLDAMPGGGAEIFAPETRRRICPDKISAEEWLNVHRTAHGLGLPTNATMLFGHLETPEDVVDHLIRLRDLQDDTGGFKAFCPLPFHPHGTALGVDRGPGGQAIARIVALSRIVLDNIPHIRVLANFLNRNLLQTLLFAGADDVGGTSMDERIARAAGAQDRQAFHAPQEIETFLRDLGLEPVLTNSAYGGKEESQRVPPPSPSGDGGVSALLRRAADGGRLSAAEAVLLHDRADLHDLGQAALERRRQLVPGPTGTFIIDRNITFTNVCVTACRFCAFHKAPGQAGEFVMEVDEIVRRAEEAASLGATQIMLQGGLNPALDLGFYESMLRRIKSRVSIWLHSLSPTEVFWLAGRAGLSVRQTLERLRAAGLDSLPGAGEILVDEVRRRVSPAKITTGQWLEVMRVAHDLGMRTTATMVYGLGETAAQRVEHFLKVRDLQDQTGGFRAFIPWSFQSANTQLSRPQESGLEYLRMVALARLVMDNVPHIQAGWVTEGPDMAQLALSFGADDFGGVLMEESVVKAAGVQHSVTAQGVVELIREAGWVPAQRNTEYRILRQFTPGQALATERSK